MTNEEAKRVLEFDLDHTYNDESKEALRTAIKALEIIPKYKNAYYKGWSDGAYAVYEHLKMCEEEQSGDLISRDMALEKMADYVASGYADSVEDFEEYSRIICQLPSVNPQEPKTDVLDKIRAEIEQTTSRYTISRERGAMGQVEWSDRLIKESEILEILDKYKAESEVTHDSLSFR